MPKLVQLKNGKDNIYSKTAISDNILVVRRKNNQTVLSGGIIQFPIIECKSNCFIISNDNSRFIATKNIKVLVIGNINFYSETTNFFIRASIFKNGVDIGNRIPINKITSWQPIQVNGIVDLKKGDYIEFVSMSDATVEIGANIADGSYINIIPIL